MFSAARGLTCMHKSEEPRGSGARVGSVSLDFSALNLNFLGFVDLSLI